MTRHARDDVITERQFELLLRATREYDRREHEFEARLALMLTGKLGMRVGEVAHFSADWVNERERMVEIPMYDQCTEGPDGGLCGYCAHRVRNHVEAMNISHEEAVKRVRDDFGGDLSDLSEEAVDELARKKQDELRVTHEEAVEKWWQPKTEQGSRDIPYDWDARTALLIEDFIDEYEIYPKSQSTVNRRIDEVAEMASLSENVYPHALRATAASFHAKRDVSAYSLMAIMGWKNIGVARAYIQSSSENAAIEVRSKHR